MRRLFPLLFAVVLLPGCTTGGQVALDPFSRTTVDPPRTGWILGQPTPDPYYLGTRQAAASRPQGGMNSSRLAAPGTNQPTGSQYQPPGGINYQGSSSGQTEDTKIAAVPGDRVRIPLAARTAPNWSEAVPKPANDGLGLPGAIAKSSSGARDDVSNTPVEQIVHTIAPRSNRSPSSAGGFPTNTAHAANTEPRHLATPRQATNIMDLSPADTTRWSSDSGVRLASVTEEVARPTASGPLYGHDPQYGWLKGKLEYSAIDRRWKLRYIPIDGKTDRFGGSVLIADPASLAGHERGQYVEIRGELGSLPEGEQGYAPEFQVRQIKRLERD